MTVMTHDKDLNAREMNCPLPILRARKALNEMVSGQVLRIVATDPGSVKDFEAFSKQTGNSLLSQSEGEEEFVFYMRKNRPRHVPAARGVPRPRHLSPGRLRQPPSTRHPAR